MQIKCMSDFEGFALNKSLGGGFKLFFIFTS